MFTGAAEPEITIFVRLYGGALLQCDVKNAYPEPTVQWWDSNNQIIHSEESQVSEQGGRFNITLKATVKKPDRYRCVATQEKIKHQAQKEINVDFDGEWHFITKRFSLLLKNVNNTLRFNAKSDVFKETKA